MKTSMDDIDITTEHKNTKLSCVNGRKELKGGIILYYKNKHTFIILFDLLYFTEKINIITDK